MFLRYSYGFELYEDIDTFNHIELQLIDRAGEGSDGVYSVAAHRDDKI